MEREIGSPRVTVLLNVHNGTRFLRAAIESVLAQTFSEFELLVVDDASTDGSAELVESFADPRIRLHRNERNLGIPGSLDDGLALARGEYVAHLDHDDVCLPERLERQVAALDEEPQVALVATWVDVTSEDGGRIGMLRGSCKSFAEFVFLCLVDSVPLHHTALMFRRQAVLDAGGYDRTLSLSVDQDLYRRVALAGHEARLVPEALVRYRTHEAQQSKRHAVLQRECNDASYARFLRALSPEVPTTPVQLLLTGDLGFWHGRSFGDGRTVARALETLLEDGAGSLGLSSGDASRLERLVGVRVAGLALGAWRSGITAEWRAAAPLVWFGLRRAGFPRAPVLAVGYGTMCVLAPILFVLWAAKRRVLQAMAAQPRFGSMRDAARRSRRLRSLFYRLGGESAAEKAKARQ